MPSFRQVQEGGRCHTYLGFLMDEGMTGIAHNNRALGMGAECAGCAHKVGQVASKMGEDMTLWYMRSVTVVGPGPACLYNTELVGSGHRWQSLQVPSLRGPP